MVVGLRVLGLLVGLAVAVPALAEDWPVYGGDDGGTRFSELDQINTRNVRLLEKVWQVNTGAAERRGQFLNAGQFQVTPILTPEAAGQSLVVCTPWNRIQALDPETGELRWEHEPKLKAFPLYNCRGVTYWENTAAADDAVCRHRIFAGTGDLRLMALDARSGELCPDFGEAGQVRLEGVIKDASPDYRRGDVKFFSPPVVVDGVLVTGSATFAKNKRVNNPTGALHALDAVTGEMRWSFDPVPRDPALPEHKNWTAEALERTGGASAWPPLSADPARGLVFVPTSSPSPDYFGGYRPGDNRYGNSTLAIKAATGELVWHFQNIHHDVWDWDTPAQPIAATITRGGEATDVVIQLTKQGLVFVFDRETGEPVFEVEEREVPAGGLPGDELSPTQPFPVKPAPLAPNGISPDDAWGLTFVDREQCRQLIDSYDHGPVFTPVSERGSLGVASINNWAGGTYDPKNNLLITNVSNLFWITTAVPADAYDPDAQESFGPPPSPIEDVGYVMLKKPLLSALGVPCNAPPWGKLVAVDMNSGDIRWEVPLGSTEKLSGVPVGIEWGTPGAAGGPISTAGGVVFIGASSDEKFRAFEAASGRKLWETRLPTSANATPMTYMINGRQYVVVASGGHVWQYPEGISDVITAFALPAD